jgi:hypothetical protein
MSDELTKSERFFFGRRRRDLFIGAYFCDITLGNEMSDFQSTIVALLPK